MNTKTALGLYLCQLQANGRSPHTVAQARRHVTMLAEWIGDRKLAAIGHEEVARFLASDVVKQRADGVARKPTSANALRSSLRCFFSFAHAAGYAPTNAARLVRRSRCPAPRPQ